MGVGASTLAIAGIAASAIGTGVSVLGSIQSSNATRQAANYQAQVAANNAAIAQGQANQATAAGATAVEQQGLKTRAEVGAIKAAEGASNVDVNTGSNVDVRSSAAELGQLDALTIRSNAAKQAYGYEIAGAGFTGQAGLAQAQAAQAGTAGGISAAGSLLSGASGVSNQYLRWQQVAGGFGSSGGGGGGGGGGPSPPALF